MKSTSHGYGKSFAIVGALYAASECIVETVSVTELDIFYGTQLFGSWNLCSHYSAVLNRTGKMELMLVQLLEE